MHDEWRVQGFEPSRDPTALDEVVCDIVRDIRAKGRELEGSTDPVERGKRAAFFTAARMVEEAFHDVWTLHSRGLRLVRPDVRAGTNIRGG